MNKPFIVQYCPIDGLLTILPFYREDERGHFLKGYEKDLFADVGICFEIQEDFESLSKQGVLRGLHFQTNNPQTKLIRVLQGEIFDVAVDLRKNSATLGRWHAEHLSADNRKSYYIPAGFAHGFLALSPTALVQYKCAGRYDRDSDTGIRWNDPRLGITWPAADVIVSNRDALLSSYDDFIDAVGGL